jgi:Family of unknown function (DUF6152)
MKHLPLLHALAATFLCFATTAGAHHSFAMFDRSRTETIAGTVKEFELINPHGWLRVMVMGTNGVQSEWPLEMGGAGQLERFGWSENAVHPGDKVTVQLHPLRDGSYGGQLISVTLPNGKVLGQRGPGAAPGAPPAP